MSVSHFCAARGSFFLVLLVAMLSGAAATVEGARRVQLTESIECFASFETGPALWNTLVALSPARLTDDVDAFATVVSLFVSGLRAGRGTCAVLSTVLLRHVPMSKQDVGACEARLAQTPWAARGGPVPVTHPLLVCLSAAERTGHSVTLLDVESEAALEASASFRAAYEAATSAVAEPVFA